MEVEAGPNSQFSETAEAALRMMIPRLPKAVRFRAQNALDHIDKADSLLNLDREMASFRSMTAEEEGAAALFKALQIRRYPGAEVLRVYSHPHKAAVSLCAQAMQNHLARGMPKLQVEFDVSKGRIDVGFLLSDLGIRTTGLGDYKIQMVEPLDIISGIDGAEGEQRSRNVISEELVNLANQAGFRSVQKLVNSIANDRNTVLYASDGKLPVSRADEGTLLARRSKTLSLIAGAVIVLQTKKHQALVCQALSAIAEMVRPRVQVHRDPTVPTQELR